MKRISNHKNYPFPFLQALLLLVVMIVTEITVGNLLGRISLNQTSKYLLLYFLIVFIPIPLFYFFRKRNTPEFNFSFSTKHPVLLASIIILAPLWNIGISLPISNLIPSNEFTEQFNNLKNFDMYSITSIISITLIAPIAEEFIFRGFILDGLLRKYKVIPSIIISALIFGIIHVNPWQMAYGTVMGLLLGFIYYKTRSMIYVILWHFANNSTYLLLYFFDTEHDNIYKHSWLYFILVPIALISIITYFRIINKRFSTNTLPWKNV